VTFAEELIQRHEGRRSKAYKDSRGIWTIGIGHNLQVDPTLYPHLQHLVDVGLTDQEIDDLFAHDVLTASKDLDLHLPWWRNLDVTRQAVILDMTFEMGIGGLMKFTHALASLQAGDYAKAAEQFTESAWDKQVPNRAKEDTDLIRG
jgi:lysozyme